MELRSVASSSEQQLRKCCLANLEDFFLYRKKKKIKLEGLSLWSSQEWAYRIGDMKEDRKLLEIKAEQSNSVLHAV